MMILIRFLKQQQKSKCKQQKVPRVFFRFNQVHWIYLQGCFLSLSNKKNAYVSPSTTVKNANTPTAFRTTSTYLIPSVLIWKPPANKDQLVQTASTITSLLAVISMVFTTQHKRTAFATRNTEERSVSIKDSIRNAINVVIGSQMRTSNMSAFAIKIPMDKNVSIRGVKEEEIL